MKTHRLAVPALLATALLAPAAPSTAGALRIVTPAHPVVHSVGTLVENGRPVPNTHIMLPRSLSDHITPDAGKQLQYHGGLVQKTPKVYLVLWHFDLGDPQGEGPYLQSFLSGVGGSSWLNSVTQYSDRAGHITNPSGQLAGVWQDNTSAISAHPTDAQLLAEASRLASHFGGADPNGSYVVATPHNHNTSGFGTQWCAYHGFAGGVAYTNLPYIPDAGGNCGAGSVNSPGTLDGVSIVAGHELAETQTDPQLDAWYNNRFGENGDICVWINLQNTNFSTGTFPTQPLWSNSNRACVQHYP